MRRILNFPLHIILYPFPAELICALIYQAFSYKTNENMKIYKETYKEIYKQKKKNIYIYIELYKK